MLVTPDMLLNDAPTVGEQFSLPYYGIYSDVQDSEVQISHWSILLNDWDSVTWAIELPYNQQSNTVIIKGL